MNKWMTLATLVALVSIVTWGCSKPSSPRAAHQSPDASDHGHEHGEGAETMPVAVWCGACGNAKGSEGCCQENAEICSKCNMIAGSPLCCKLEGDFEGKDLCGKCGEVAGSENCCKEGAEKCAKCNLHVGSPLCCKLAKSEGEHEHEHAEGESHEGGES